MRRYKPQRERRLHKADARGAPGISTDFGIDSGDLVDRISSYQPFTLARVSFWKCFLEGLKT